MSWIWSVNWRHNSWSLFSFHLMVYLASHLCLTDWSWCWAAGVPLIPPGPANFEVLLQNSRRENTQLLWAVKHRSLAIFHRHFNLNLPIIAAIQVCLMMSSSCTVIAGTLLRLTFYQVITPFSGTCTERLNTAGPALSWPGETVQMYPVQV